MDTASWQGPPTDVLGQTVPMRQLVARTERAMIALQHAVAFPQGCLLVLQLAVRQGPLDDAAWERACAVDLGSDPGLVNTGGGLKFSVSFPGGSKATPILDEVGADSSLSDQRYDSHRQLWLWPLPPSSPFQLTIEWQNMELDQAAITLDGAAIALAAENAQPFWA